MTRDRLRRFRTLGPLGALACAQVDAPPAASMIPLSFRAEVGFRTGPTRSPARAPDGSALVGQTYLLLDVTGLWSEPSPEPQIRCSAVWTWPPDADLDPSPAVRGWLDDRAASWGVQLRPGTAATSSTDCRFVDDVAAAALLGDGLAVALAPSPYLRWQDAVAELPDGVSPPGVDLWPWLDSTHVLGATLAVAAPGPGAPVGELDGVAVALTLDEGHRIVPTGGGLLQTLGAGTLLDDPRAGDALIRATALDRWSLAYADWSPPPEATTSRRAAPSLRREDERPPSP